MNVVIQLYPQLLLKLYRLIIKESILKAKLIKSQILSHPHYYFTIIYVLEVIYIHSICKTEIPDKGLLPCISAQ